MNNKEKNELIARLTLKKKWLGLIVTIFYIGTVWYTYKAHTQPPDSFVSESRWAICYFLCPVFSLLVSLLILYILNLKCIEIYNDKIIRKVAVKWLFPFGKVLQFRLNELKFRVFDRSGVYTIVFYNSNKAIEIVIDTSLFGFISYEKSDMLKLIDFLIENCKREEDKEVLEKLREEVSAWKNK